jgi:hypothetical protein
MKLTATTLVALVSALHLCTPAFGYTPVTHFCDDSEWDEAQPTFDSAAGFSGERHVFLELRDFFADATIDLDLDNTTVEAGVIELLKEKLAQEGFNNTQYGFTITRSNGDITMDTSLGVNPVIENHGGRYSLGKPMLCRDKQTVVFDYSYITRTGSSYRFWSQAVQTGLQKQYFAFRWNIPVM